MIDENQKNLLINNAKSLGNSLGTANKKLWILVIKVTLDL